MERSRNDLQVTERKANQPYWFWGIAGLLLLGLHVALAWLSKGYGVDGSAPDKLALTLVAVELGAFGIFWVAVARVSRAPGKGLLIWIIVVGLGLRAAMMFSTPMFEDDYYRYMWDGAVSAEGMSPFRYSPNQLLEGSDQIPDRFRELAEEGRPTLSRVNHPHLRTIYPPVAQAVFAAAYLVKPWSIPALRLVLFLFDVATLLLLMTALRSLGLSLLWIVTYSWNPLVVHEIFNSVHMDVITLPFALGAVILSARGRYLGASFALALAVGVKLWPVVLLPVVLSPVMKSPKRLIPCLALFCLVCAGIFLPIHAAGLDEFSGFTAYGRYWEMNDALYMLFSWGVDLFLRAVQLDPGFVQIATRFLVTGILIAWIVWISRRPTDDPALLWERSLLIVAALFLLSPTQFPWYYLWVAPFLVIRPRPSLLILNGLLSLYYLRFYFEAHNNVAYFDKGIVWLEFVPVWLLLIREWVKGRSTAEPASYPG